MATKTATPNRPKHDLAVEQKIQSLRLTAILKFAPGGAKRLRALLNVLGNNFQGADKVGTLHDMRFVFLDNDTKLLFATAYDGDWDTYTELLDKIG